MKQLITLIIGFIIAGCSSMNIPPKLNTPSFEKKRQLEVELGTSTNSLYQNMSYSITNRFAVISSGLVSYDYLFNVDYNTGGVIFEYLPNPQKAKYLDIGLGLYQNDTKLKSIFIGAGLGESQDPYKSFFLQGNYGIKKDKMEYGVTTRLSYIYYPYTFMFKPNIEEIKEYNIFGLQPCVYFNFTNNRFVYTFNAGTYLTNYNKYSDWFVRDYPQNTLIHLSVGLKYKIGKE